MHRVCSLHQHQAEISCSRSPHHSSLSEQRKPVSTISDVLCRKFAKMFGWSIGFGGIRCPYSIANWNVIKGCGSTLLIKLTDGVLSTTNAAIDSAICGGMRLSMFIPIYEWITNRRKLPQTLKAFANLSTFKPARPPSCFSYQQLFGKPPAIWCAF